MYVRTDRWFAFPADPTAVWAALEATDRYPTWWPWLSDFAATGLHAGAVWRCSVRSPLRTTLRFRLVLDRVGEGTVTARLVGDLGGTAQISLLPSRPGATALRLEACIAPNARTIATLSRLAPAVARWSHDRIVETAARQFADALSRTP